MPILPKVTKFSLQCIKKEVSDEIDFSHVDKYEKSLQIHTMMFDGG